MGPLDAESFAQLLARARRHDEEAVAALYQHAFPSVYRFVLTRIQRRDLAEDIVAETFLTMVETIGDLRAAHEAGFFAWLLRIAQGKITRAFRSMIQSRSSQHPLPESGHDLSWLEPALMATDLTSNPPALHEWRELMHELGMALGTLSDEQQIVIIGRFLQGQSTEALAQELGKSSVAIRVIQHRALGALAKQLNSPHRTGERQAGGQA